MKQQELRELMAKHRIIATDADGLQKFTDIVCEEAEAERHAIAADSLTALCIKQANAHGRSLYKFPLWLIHLIRKVGGKVDFVTEAQVSRETALKSQPAPVAGHGVDLEKVRELTKDASISCSMAKTTRDEAWVDDCQEKLDRLKVILDADQPVEVVDGLAEALRKFEHPGHRVHLLMHHDDHPYFENVLKAARLQLKRQGGA